MKLVMITNYWKNSEGGGIEKTLTKLVKNYQDHFGMEVKVIFREGSDENNYFTGRSKLSFLFKAKKHLQEISPDMIHVQGGWFCLLPALSFKRKKNVPILYMFHTSISKELPWFKKWFYNRYLNKCDVVSFVSHTHKKNIETVAKLSLKTQTKVIISGVDRERVEPSQVEFFKKKYDITNSYPILLGMGLTAIKHKAEGAKRLIDAVEILADNYPNVKLLLTREGAQIDDLKGYVKSKKLEDKVVFTGTIPDSWVALAACDVYTHISIGESLGLAALEAMSIGKPIVAARGGGIEDVIRGGHDGLLVNIEPSDIANTIKSLMEDKQLVQKLSVNAIKTIEEGYTWKKVAEQYVDLYKNMLKN